ncbi:MAG: hypothetical protein CL694_00290 [Chloroflexi bacterium]|jgi:hypothetical protein|nr:hypothetical protein [Chloroflexota bacterium]|tara:strand:- start:583 stop:903 length:321 start_codon:yes stop_codon:yes gene_type:complete
MNLMRNRYGAIAIIGVLLAVAGCSRAATPIGNTIDIKGVDFQQVQKMRTGAACETRLLFNLIGPFGDQSIVRATRKAKIRHVAVVDREIHSFLGLINRACLRVYGQ